MSVRELWHTHRRVIVSIIVTTILAASIPASIITLLLAPVVAENSEKIDRSAATTEEVIEIMHADCEGENRRWRQVKIRAEAEQVIGTIILDVAKVNGSLGPGFSFPEVQAQLEPALDRIQILPLPDCDKRDARLRDVLEG